MKKLTTMCLAIIMAVSLTACGSTPSLPSLKQEAPQTHSTAPAPSEPLSDVTTPDDPETTEPQPDTATPDEPEPSEPQPDTAMPDETEAMEPDLNTSTDDNTPVIQEEPEEAVEHTQEDTAEGEVSEPPAPAQNDESPSGLRPEFKEAMDSYEAFYDEYCDFMMKYQENPTDLTLLMEYSKMLIKLAEMDAAFEKWESDDLSTEELAYYLDVSNRVAKKLLDVATTE